MILRKHLLSLRDCQGASGWQSRSPMSGPQLRNFLPGVPHERRFHAVGMSAKAQYLTDQCMFWLERSRAGSVNAGRPQFWLGECRRLAAELIGAGLQAERRFVVEITRPDGTKDRTVAHGGTSFEHAANAIEGAGCGARISVRQLPAHVAGEPA